MTQIEDGGLVPVNQDSSKPTRSRKGRTNGIQPKKTEYQEFESTTQQQVGGIADLQRQYVQSEIEGVLNLAETGAAIIHEARQALPNLTAKRLAEMEGEAPMNPDFFRSTAVNSYDGAIAGVEALRDLIN